MWPKFFVAPLVFSLVLATPKPRDECCNLALETRVYLNKSIPLEELRCGQKYSPDLSPAPDISVPTSWWCENCKASGEFDGNIRSFWKGLLFLGANTLPLAILMVSSLSQDTFPSQDVTAGKGTIRSKRVTNDMTDFLRLLTQAVIIIIDIVSWFLLVMLMCGPIVFSSLHEAMLDYGVLQYLHDCHERGSLRESGSMKKIELLIAIVAGNLKKTGLAVDPQKDIEAKFRARLDRADEEMRKIFETRPSFKPIVGASFFHFMVFSFSMFNHIWDKGEDEISARDLAFGIWCFGVGIMITISGFFASSCDPRPVKTFCSFADRDIGVDSGLSSWPTLVNQATAYESNWMWEGSMSKMEWLRHTAAWEDTGFRKQLITIQSSWPLVSVVALLLTTIPSALAVFLEHTIRGPDEKSISRVIILYGCAQCFLIFYFGLKVLWSNLFNNRVELSERDRFNDEDRKGKFNDFLATVQKRVMERQSNPRSNRQGQQDDGGGGFDIRVGDILDVPSFVGLGFVRRRQSEILIAARFVLVMLVGVCFETSIGSICHRSTECPPIWHMFHARYSTIALASDTAQERHAHLQLILAGYATMGFLGFIAFLGWRQHRDLRLTIAAVLAPPDQETANPIFRIHRTVVADFMTMNMSSVYSWASTTYTRLRNKLVRPRLRLGFRRLEWCCVSLYAFASFSCGEHLYGDFDNVVPEAVDDLAAILAKDEASTRTTPNGSSESRSQHSLLSVSHPIIPTAQVTHYTSDNLLQSLPNLEMETLALATSERPAASNAVSKFFEICVKNGRWERRLGEINISEARNDNQFFLAIKQKYLELRRSKKNFFLEPMDIRYVRFSVENRVDVGILSRPEETA